jgi:hypothetical protein
MLYREFMLKGATLWKKLILAGIICVFVAGVFDAVLNLPVVTGCVFQTCKRNPLNDTIFP